METWQWLVLAIPAAVLVISVVMIVRVLTASGSSGTRAPETSSLRASDEERFARPADPELSTTSRGASPDSPAEVVVSATDEDSVRLESDFDDLFRASEERELEHTATGERAEETTGGGRRVD